VLRPASVRPIVLIVSSTLSHEERGLWSLLAADGRPLLSLFALGLGLAGAFAWFVSLAGEVLPHELRFLGMTAEQLRGLADGRVTDFMTHDRVAFGGTLIALAILYLWLVAGPLASGERWAWWLIAGTGALGFASFLSYIGTGYLDVWHAVASAGLLPPFVVGLWLSRRRLLGRRSTALGRAGAAAEWPAWRSPGGAGRGLLGLTGLGLVLAGSTILTIGTVVVFVPEDLIYIGFDRAALDALNPRLVPLIAHDRAGFGGGLLTIGLLVIGCLAFGRPSRSLRQAILVAGTIGFGAAIGIHGLVGYLDASHVGPAAAGAVVFTLGVVLTSAPGAVSDAEQTREGPIPASDAA
jgi:hypothetical protein